MANSYVFVADSHLTAFIKAPSPAVTPVQLMRPGIGQEVGDLNLYNI